MNLIPDEIDESPLQAANNSSLLDRFNYQVLNRHVLPLDGTKRACYVSSKVKLVDTLKIYAANETSASFVNNVPPLARVGMCKYRRKYFLEYDVSDYKLVSTRANDRIRRTISRSMRKIVSKKLFKIEHMTKNGLDYYIVVNFCTF